jgi:hypothetical protein
LTHDVQETLVLDITNAWKFWSFGGLFFGDDRYAIEGWTRRVRHAYQYFVQRETAGADGEQDDPCRLLDDTPFSLYNNARLTVVNIFLGQSSYQRSDDP